MSVITFRAFQPADQPFLQEMLFTALFVRPGAEPFPPQIIHKPELQKYLAGFGQWDNDIAIIAEANNNPIGAIWGRTFPITKPGYGFVDEATPELTMAIKSDYRNLGIGRQLLAQIESTYQERGIQALSLSVDQLSPAYSLYQRAGFTIYEEAGTAFTMRKLLG